VLADVAAECDLDTPDFRAALESHTYRERVEELLQHGREEIQITGVPLSVIGDLKLAGVQPQRSLRAAIERELAKS